MLNKREHLLSRIIDSGIVAVIRISETDKLLRVIDAIHDGGVRCLEITMTVPHAVEMIQEVSARKSDDFILGAGTVCDMKTAQRVMDAGADFVVSPVLIPALIDIVHKDHKVVMPGGYSPTEIFNAWQSGADIVKIFPATVGGPSFIKAVKAPLPEIRMMPTGGVSLANAADFIKAGCCCIGVGTSLLDREAIKEEDYSLLTQNAEKFIDVVENARKEMVR